MTGDEPRPGTPIVVMGVSAAGKSAVGRGIAQRLSVPFIDADDLHPQANIAKMAAGNPLDDDDRWPWLDAVATRLAAHGGVVVACSALKRAYRDRLRAGASGTVFVHLAGSYETLSERAGRRHDHFMPPSLLRSQLDTLEALQSDEAGFTLDVAPTVAVVIDQAMERLT